MENAKNVVDRSHRGQVVQHIVRNSKDNGMRVTMVWLAEKLGVHRKTLDSWWLKHNLESDKIRQIGRIIKHDFSEQFPELRADLMWTLSEETAIYGKKDPFAELDRCKVERDRYKDQYIAMLEKFNALQEEFYHLKLTANVGK